MRGFACRRHIKFFIKGVSSSSRMSKAEQASLNVYKKKPFKMGMKNAILTYKDVGLSKEDILLRCLTVPNLFGAAVAKEKYGKGEFHFHVFLATTKQVSLGLPELDTIGGVHGNYMPVQQTPMKALAYVIKNNDYCATESVAFEEYIQSALASYAYRAPSDVFFAAYTSPTGRLPPRNFQVNVKRGKPNKF